MGLFFFSSISNESKTRTLSICGEFSLEKRLKKGKKEKRKKADHTSVIARLLEGAEREREPKNLAIYKK